jgi:TIR domain
MKFLNSIEIPGGQRKRIELYQGDITSLTAAEGFDLLVVSAYPDDYTPTDDSLIGALYRKELSVAALAMNKEVDLRKDFSCWLSNEFKPQNSGLRFRRILCFEPLNRGEAPELVGDIFRALIPILAGKPEIRTMALPIVAVGDQGYAVADILTPLLKAAFHWLKAGLPLDFIKIVIRSEAQSQEALQIFSDWKDEYFPRVMFSRSKNKGSLRHYSKVDLDQLRSPILTSRSDDFLPRSESPESPESPQRYGDMDYDVFISYSRTNASESEALEQALREARPDIRIFVDRKEIDIGSAWQPEIFESLDKCHKVVALLSPAYLSSKMCKEEYNIAWIRSRETGEDLIFPIYLYTAGLPTYMKYRNYLDCREGDRSKIAEASRKLLAALEAPKV